MLKNRKLFTENGPLYGYLFLIPYGVFFICLYTVPLLDGFYTSLCNYQLPRPRVFIGLDNYTSLLKDSAFIISIKNTLIFVLESTPMLIGFPLFVAIGLKQIEGTKWSIITRTMFILPMLVSVSAAALLWKLILTPETGLLNYYLIKLNLPPQAWLSRPNWSLFGIAIVTLWWTAGFNILIFLAGLEDIPVSLYEAARIDGATSWKEFLYITLPCLTPSMTLVCINQVISSFKVFGQVLLLTNGGPGLSSYVLVQHLYLTGFRFNKLGIASATGWYLFLLVIIFTITQFRLFSRVTKGY